MKKIVKIALFAAGSFMISPAFSQTHKDSTLGHKIGNTAKKVGHKTSEIAAKGAAGVVDKKYDEKVGPAGQTIYIDKNSAYYYINKKGHKVYVKKANLKDKPAEKK